MPLRIIRHFLLLGLAIVATPAMAVQTISLFEGDIVVTASPTARAITLSDSSQLWPAGIVPYTIDPTLPIGSIYAITTAIEHWNKVGGITLMPLEEARDLSPTPISDSVRFIPGEFCASWVGKRGGLQDVWIAPYCPSGSVMHEIGHLLGLEHEHTRPDRDQYIEIHWNNIEPDKRHNFDAAPPGSRMPGEYDYDSIMHYGSHNFSSNGLATISSIDGLTRNIGQRTAPSEGDLQAITELYGSDLSVATRVAPVAQGTELDIYVSNLTSRGAHDISVEIGISPDAQVLASLPDTWKCVSSNENRSLLCHLPRLPASATELLTLRLPEQQELSSIDVSLSSKTPDLDLSNNNSSVLSDDVGELPEQRPVPVVAEAINDKALLQDDAVAHVALSGGSVSVRPLLLLILLLLVRKARSRINFEFTGRLFCVHGRHLLSR